METTMLIYVNGSDEAIELYQKAFHAELGYAMPSEEDDCRYYHAELNIYGQSLTVVEAKHVLKFSDSPSEEAVRLFSQTERLAGNTMQFCVYFDNGSADKIKQAYEVLRKGGVTIVELGPCFSSPCMVDFIDKFGVRWCFLELD
jgi:PhnB protein